MCYQVVSTLKLVTCKNQPIWSPQLGQNKKLRSPRIGKQRVSEPIKCVWDYLPLHLDQLHISTHLGDWNDGIPSIHLERSILDVGMSRAHHAIRTEPRTGLGLCHGKIFLAELWLLKTSPLVLEMELWCPKAPAPCLYLICGCSWIWEDPEMLSRPTSPGPTVNSKRCPCDSLHIPVGPDQARRCGHQRWFRDRCSRCFPEPRLHPQVAENPVKPPGIQTGGHPTFSLDPHTLQKESLDCPAEQLCLLLPVQNDK